MSFLIGILVMFASLLAFSARYAFTGWSNLSMDEIIFELKAPLTGTGNGMIRDYIVTAVVPTIVIVLLFAAVMIFLRRSRDRQKRARLFFLFGSLSLIAVTLIVGEKRLKLSKWIRGQVERSSFIEDHYADPEQVEITFPEKKRNLIYIYLESMEIAYTDEESGGAFEQNIIPELTQLAKENETFSGDSGQLNGGYAASGTIWTMGAMFGMNTGLPLKLNMYRNDMSTQDSFFPDIPAMGTILEENGYHNVLMLGSNAAFGGREMFFTEHGDYEIEDYGFAKEAGRIPEDYHVWWGMEDEKLFAYTKEKLLELAEKDEPFNMTLLTVDTHFEDGYVCRLCKDEFGDNQYANVMACSSRQTIDFVNWIKEQDFYEDTTIILTGDHPTMDVDFCEDVPEDYVRKVYMTIINGACEPADISKYRTFTTFDMFPTTLAALGATIEGDRLGLGTNLYSDTETLAEQYGYTKIDDEIDKRSVFLEELEQIDLMSKKLIKRYRKAMKGGLDLAGYNPENKVLSVLVRYMDDMKNIPGGVAYLEATVTNDNTGEQVVLKLEHFDDGTFQAGVDASAWAGDTVTITVDIVNKEGNRYEKMMEKQIEIG